MKKIISGLALGALCMGLTSMGMVSAEDVENAAAPDKHKIGVIVYNITDEQVVAFRDYLENYIATCFQDVEFLYSANVNTPEQEMEFIQTVCDAGAEGILSFNSYDLKAEVELCEKNDVYYMRASSSISDAEYDSVKENPYFIGVIGPGDEMEYQAGYDMAKHFVESYDGKEFFICSGGSGFGVGMHIGRTKGILDGIQDACDVKFDVDTAELAASHEAITAEAGDVKVCVAPGFLDSEVFLPAVQEAYQNNPYGIVLSAYPLCDLENTIDGAKVGIIDCYDSVNNQLFENDKLHYVTGKFNSTIGPSFAAMYNAVTGHPEVFREDGNAFRLIQGFWTSDNLEDYAEKFVYSSSIVLNAYNYDDLDNVCVEYNPDTSFEEFKALVAAYTYEDAVARRES